ncbi:head GIN domain-containing protein [Bizionia paragorgiae]|uniref:Putative auto-transporter adhesin, head GIN domain n=1 Tax=Bizionia paragorgiae TaxID=283786 RepID=A0A1H4CUA9_BIZPA|nr:head GIN domain-containing protein [Bizionia paragorgiae]SEA63955.1 Putative auto-transporter adhesin, head GIN domain [Bizionia paragorgiae]
MRKLAAIFVVLVLMSCNGESVPDCFQNSGDIIEKSFAVEDFLAITVHERIEMIVKEAPLYTVTVQTGEYLMSDIDVVVDNGRLVLRNNNACNLSRDYGITKIIVTAPNLTEIRSSTGLPVRSEGALNYETLKLVSENYREDFYTSGVFELEVNASQLFFIMNGLSSSYISGATTHLNVFYASGDARFEGRHLLADHVTIYHRGTNDITVNPQESLKANLVSTGNVIAVNTPPVQDINEQYTGRVIFE